MGEQEYVPDLAIEIAPANHTYRDRSASRTATAGAGVSEVWLISTETPGITANTLTSSFRPGFSPVVDSLFAAA
jgi:Uma2 family endonuclease